MMSSLVSKSTIMQQIRLFGLKKFLEMFHRKNNVNFSESEDMMPRMFNYPPSKDLPAPKKKPIIKKVTPPPKPKI